MELRNPYIVLNLEQSASAADVKDAFKRSLIERKWSPADCDRAQRQLTDDSNRREWSARMLDVSAWTSLITPLRIHYRTFDFDA